MNISVDTEKGLNNSYWKSISKLVMERNFLNLMKRIYKKPTRNIHNTLF